MTDKPTNYEPDVHATKPMQVSAPTQRADGLQAATSKPDRFVIVRRHASGGLGEVLLAEDQELRRQVALKRIQLKYAESEEYRRRFLREAAITARLEHPGIVPVYTLAQGDDGQLCYVMRFIQGESLAEAIKQLHNRRPHALREATPNAERNADSDGEQRLLFRQLLQRFVTVCNTLAYAHSRGVVHRDVKPANIMIGHYGETLLVDWGLAKVWRHAAGDGGGEDPLGASSLPPNTGNGAATGPTLSPLPAEDDDLLAGEYATRMGEALGTPAYMSPEQASGQWDRVGPASDIYSLGAILYEILTGQKSVQCEDAVDALIKAQAGDIVAPRLRRRDVPPPLEAVCLKALAREPCDRYPTAKDLADDVEHWLADESVGAWAEPWHFRAGRWLRRHRTSVIACGVAVLLLILGVMTALYLWETGKQEQQFLAQTHRSRLQFAAEAQEKIGLALLHANHFEEAATVFANAAEGLKQEPQLADLRDALLARQDRARRVSDFYRLAQKGERYFVRDLEKETIEAHEQALKALYVLDHPQNWWQCLPADDLTSTQTTRLQSETHLRLLYLAFLRARRGRMNANDPQVTQQGHRAALDAAAMAAHFQPCHAGYTVEYYCRSALGDVSGALRVRQILAASQPTTLADFYLGGMLHYWIAIMPSHPLNQVLRLAFFGLPGFSVDHAMAMAESHLRTAATRDPDHFATYYWLARLLSSDGRPAAAELAASVCIGLRPDYADGYLSRASAVLRQAKQARSVAEGEQLFERALQDLNMAIQVEPGDFYPYLHRAEAYAQREQWPSALADCDAAIRVGAEKSEPDFYQCHVVRARANRALGRANEAVQDYTAALKCFPHFIQAGPQDIAPLFAGRGAVYLQSGSYSQAIADFTAAIKTNSSAPLYQQRGMAHLRNADYELALNDFVEAIRLSSASSRQEDLQQLHRQRALALAYLGRQAEALAAVEDQAKNPKLAPAALCDLAGIYAVAAAKDPGQADEHAARAVQYLNLAVQRGYRDLENLESNTCFQPLRKRADFEKLLATLRMNP